jgi:fatty acid desaturase
VTQRRQSVPKHEDWSGAWQWLSLLLGFVAVEAILLSPAVWSRWWLTVLVWLVLGHLMHGHLIAFHEAAHRSLIPNQRLNDLVGWIIGLFSFMSPALYRATHYTHHGWLGSERDEELWPFVSPRIPRWKRRLAAILELTVGLVYTPLLFLRSYLRRDTLIRNAQIRRRIAGELIGIVVCWAVIITLAAVYDFGAVVVKAYLVPAWIAGNLQSLRKYVEHMGVFGTTNVTLTRSIMDRTLSGRIFAFTLYNEHWHAVHHEHSEIPQRQLPAASGVISDAAQAYVFPTYAAALLEVARHLQDPRVGAQWVSTDSRSAASGVHGDRR